MSKVRVSLFCAPFMQKWGLLSLLIQITKHDSDHLEMGKI